MEKHLASIGIKRKNDTRMQFTRLQDLRTLPPGTYNADEFAQKFPEEYRQFRKAGFRGVGVGQNVVFKVKQ